MVWQRTNESGYATGFAGLVSDVNLVGLDEGGNATCESGNATGFAGFVTDDESIGFDRSAPGTNESAYGTKKKPASTMRRAQVFDTNL